MDYADMPRWQVFVGLIDEEGEWTWPEEVKSYTAERAKQIAEGRVRESHRRGRLPDPLRSQVVDRLTVRVQPV
jgi:hypothetical protein